jgi:hypothetical protein
MSIINKSRQTSMDTTLKVQLDLNERGWMVMRSEEECSYDLIVDRGIVEGFRLFQTIQVKTIPRTSSRPGGGKDVERVSNGGKTRNNYWYYDEDVTFIASIVGDEVVYWHKDDYRYKKPSDFRNMKRYDFPINENMFSYRRPRIEDDKNNKLDMFFA